MVIQNPDDELQAEIFEEAMKEFKGGNADLLNDVLHNLGEIGIEGAMKRAQVANPERDDSYMTLYSTLDGTPSTVLRSMVPKLLRKRLATTSDVPPDLRGKLAFSIAQTITPKVADVPCMLHPRHALREWLDDNGLQGRTCTKMLANTFSQRKHMETRHKAEYAQMKDAQDRERDEEQRAFQRATIEMMKAQGRVNGKSN